MLKNFSAVAKGLIWVMVVTFFAFLLSNWTGYNLILLSLALGMLVGNFIAIPNAHSKGIKWGATHFLEFAIIFLAFGIDYQVLLNLGWQSILIVILSMTLLLIITVFLAKKMKCPGSTGWLVGFGTAVCGSAAIAAIAPDVSKDKSDIGIALAVINLFGLVGMILFPFLIPMLPFSEFQSALLIGGSLHSMGNVAGAGMGIGGTIGEMAIAIKLGRIAMLTPALLFFRILIQKNQELTEKQKIKLSLPWYLWGFIIISIVSTWIDVPSVLTSLAKTSSNFLLAGALGAIGLNVSFKSMVQGGKKGLLFGLIIFLIYLTLLAFFALVLG
jgi:uncharacterized integral membrane protein (TIGR00698 family)